MTQQTLACYNITVALKTTGQVNALDTGELPNEFLKSDTKQ
jgi:hypothetical protein